VREYWVIDPQSAEVLIHLLGDNRHWQSVSLHREKGKVKIQAVPGLAIDLDLVFRPLPGSDQ
jgi:Uma2 family endonuclease